MQEEARVSERIGQEFGNYRLVRLIGRGGFAEVYLGEHLYLKTQAAIKILQTRLSHEEQENFYAEARTVAHLQHEHVVRVLEFGLKDDSIPFLVMEYASNGTLRERFPRGSAAPIEHILPPFKQMAAALHYAHSEYVIHRDIKPENMLLGAHNEVLLSDFGIALMAKGSRRRDTQEVAGTVTYMAPEQLLGQPTVASDQYSLGVVVYEWLTGERLFRGSFIEIATQHILKPPPSLRERVPGISEAIDHVVLKTLAKDPQQRFASVQDFAEALEVAAQSGQFYDVKEAKASVEGQPSTLSDLQMSPSFLQRSGWQKMRASPKKMKLALLLLALLVVVGSVLFAFGRINGQPDVAQQMQILYNNATRGEPQIEDSLGAEGPLALADNPGCIFKGKAIHTIRSAFTSCTSIYASMSNFAYQVEMTIVRGTSGGLVFRYSPISHPKGGVYYFAVTTQGQFSLDDETLLYLNKQFFQSGMIPLLRLQQSAAIKTGLNRTNLLTVIARGQNIYLYINKQFVGSVKDSTSLEGMIGMFSNTSGNVDIAYRNLQIWTL
jgi:eukaryotic-like serine/threonine-protein kinase